MQVELNTITAKKDGSSLKRPRYEVVIDGYSYPFNSKKHAQSLYQQTLDLLDRKDNETTNELPSQCDQQASTEDAERSVFDWGLDESYGQASRCDDESRCTPTERTVSDHASTGYRNRKAEERELINQQLVRESEESIRESENIYLQIKQSQQRVEQIINNIGKYNSILQDGYSNGSTISPSDFKLD